MSNHFPVLQVPSCFCDRSSVQCYECQVCTKTPFSGNKLVCFDMCLAAELKFLWSCNVITTGSCCEKHRGPRPSTADGYIGVTRMSIEIMHSLGYESFHDRDDHFYPKTVVKKVG